MSAFRWTLGTFFISAFFFFGATAQAEDEPMGLFDGVDLSYSTLSVEDTRLDVVEGNPDLVLSAKLMNTGADERTFRASVEFRGASDAKENELVRVQGLESYTLRAGEERNIAFSVARPRALSGDYRTTLVIGDEKGNVAATRSLNTERLTASEKVAVTGCVFGPSDGDTGVMVPTESENAVIAIVCELALSNGNLESVSLVNRVVDSRTSLPVVLSDATVPVSKVATPVRYTVPVSVDPGQYSFEVVAVNGTGDEVSVPARTPLHVYGHGGRIVGLSELTKNDAVATLPVGVALELYDDATYTLSISLQSGDVVCADPVTVEVQDTNLKDATLSVTKNCPNPVLSATLLMDGSTVMDQAEKTMNPITGIVTPMMETSLFDGILPKLPWIIVAILGALAGYFIWQKERLRRMAPVWILAIASVYFGFSPHQASAAGTGFTLFCNNAVQTCPSTSNVFYNLSTVKNTFAPGETITVDLTISSDDNPVPINNLCPVVQMRINSGSLGSDQVPGCYSANQFTTGLDLTLTMTAPMATGPFTIGAVVGQNGYFSPPSGTISGLSVAAAPTPTATLNISPSTATFPTTITYTLSSTNAQSCEVIQTSPTTVTFINKSANITGTTTQSQVAVGSYQFQTRCWSGTNGTGTVSSTDTDSLTINAPAPQPTANFTSMPACSIPDGRSGCNTTLFWTSSNVSTVVLTNCTDVQLTAKGSGPQSFSPVYVPYNSGCYRLHDGTRTGTILDQKNASATCSGQPWQASTGTCGNVNAICGSADGTVQNDIFALSGSQICQAGDFATSDSYLSGDSISSDKKNFTAGSSNANYLGVAWRCDGLGNGYDQWCRAYKTPLCGSANGKSFSSPPTDPTSGVKQALCQVGIPTSVTTNASTYTWQCNNTGSSPVSCSATRTGGATAQITARVVVASNDGSWWQKLISFVTGRDHTAQATGPDANITTNGTAAIDWTSSGASSCAVTKQGSTGTIASTLTGTQSLSGATLGVGTHIYNLNCAGAPLDSVRVVVTAAGGSAPSTPGGLSASTSSTCGGNVSITWNSVSGATSYELRDGSTQIYSGASTSFSHTGLTPGSSHTYTVRATNSNGSSAWSGSVTATASAACSGGGGGGPSVTLTASPTTISAGGSSTLTWTTSGGVTSCWATGGTDVTWNNTWQSATGGTKSVSPAVTTTYSIQCWNGAGTSTGIRSATVNVSGGGGGPAPTLTLSATPTTVAPGGTSTLSWTTTGSVTSCWSSGGEGAWTNSWQSTPSGSRVVSPSATATYSMECWNAGGQSTGVRGVTVTVSSGTTCNMSPFTIGLEGRTSGGASYGSSPYRYGFNRSKEVVHQGLLAVGEKGVIQVTDAGESGSYPGSTANGVTTTTYSGVPVCGENHARLPDPTGWLTAGNCQIAIGASTCVSPVSWNISSWAPNVRVFQTDQFTVPNTIATNVNTYSDLNRTVQYGSGVSNLFSLAWTYTDATGNVAYQVVSSATATATCVAGSSWDGTICSVSAVPARVSICPASATLGVGTTQQFRAYYTPAGTTFAGCGTPNGTNVTSSANWTHAAPTVATVNNSSSKGLVTGVSAGNADFTVTYTGLTAFFSVVVSCTPTNSCSSAGSQAKASGICAGDTFNINDGCGGTLTCSGSRVCDYNWKEVAP